MASGQAAAPNFFQLYRRTALGNALFESLDELISSGHITPQLAVKVLVQFDKSASLTLGSMVKTKCSAKGKMAVYNQVDDVWTFILQNPTFKLENQNETLGPLPGKVKIVACKAEGSSSK